MSLAKPLGGRSALIAGGTSGVGLATARRFAGAGVERLFLLGRDAARGSAAVGDLRDSGIEADFVAADAAT